ncbi:hypothetical protein NQ317_009630 [Molorchus minor]|uniref:Tyrosine specific protein phosphatases domain-containing protein n=1 Tax=Molorchus minor TaxID=1323400 RepID=A0ABQ9IVL5_9CUCU|nr:hypothetical protein NQ317_009630 [Molorchus minor]
MGNGKTGAVPKGWLYCPPNGNRLIAGKFMPLKTPLSNIYDEKVPEELRFTPKRIFASARSNRVKLGLWIDLTNTDRYYYKGDIERQGSKYVKLQLSGHGETPSRGKTQRFVSIVHNHLIRNPSDCVAVHCTHGFNRTGFLITSFLVEKLRYDVKSALEVFAGCRPPGIYRGNYIEELFQRYGNIRDILPVPLLPEWCDKKDNNRRKRNRHRRE